MMRQFRNCLPVNVDIFESPDHNRTGRLTKNFFKRNPEPATERE